MKTNDMSDEDKIDIILIESDEELESANYHNWIGISRKLYDDLKQYVSPIYHLDLARSIARAIWEKI